MSPFEAFAFSLPRGGPSSFLRSLADPDSKVPPERFVEENVKRGSALADPRGRVEDFRLPRAFKGRSRRPKPPHHPPGSSDASLADSDEELAPGIFQQSIGMIKSTDARISVPLRIQKKDQS